ncbi:MAG: sulfate reduction electron transfer complex DsrMKJOP subunit DsrO [Planctomycetota bacterium]|jgi:molybdopterin-containing oxidoreductase family iron-sulfur binding subunit
MEQSTRRNFLKAAGVAGLAAAGIGAKPVCDALTRSAIGADAAAPEQGLTAKRWAMVIDLDRCRREKGCTKCIDACHAEHNVPEIKEPTREVKWIWKEEFPHAFPMQENRHLPGEVTHQPVLLLCNHCDDPPCVRVCPTQATWKREDGVVMMDMHRCIGCRYCMAGCPYGSRSFNWKDPRPHLKGQKREFPTRMKGVVEKCNFCAERLARGEGPACVKACAAKGLLFGDLDDPKSEVRAILSKRFSIRRKPNLGTEPMVYYLV